MRRTAIHLPEAPGQRQGLISARNVGPELSLLFVGDSTMAGVGASEQTAALPCLTATLLAKRLARTVRWQIMARSGVNTDQALSLVVGTNHLPTDVLITSLGTNDVISQIPPHEFVEAYEKLVDTWRSHEPTAVVFISGLPPLHLTPAFPQPLRWFFGRYARLLDEHLQQWAASKLNVCYLSLQWASQRGQLAADGFHPGEGLYKAWAELLAIQIADRLLAQTT